MFTYACYQKKQKNFRDVYYIHTRLSDFLKGSIYYKTCWPREKKSNHVSNSGTNFKKMYFKVLFVVGLMLPEISSDIVDLNSKLIVWYFGSVTVKNLPFSLSRLFLYSTPLTFSRKKTKSLLSIPLSNSEKKERRRQLWLWTSPANRVRNHIVSYRPSIFPFDLRTKSKRGPEFIGPERRYITDSTDLDEIVASMAYFTELKWKPSRVAWFRIARKWFLNV